MIENNFDGKQLFSPGIKNPPVVFGNNMQDYIIERRIVLMAMKVEMRRAGMYLNISGPFGSVN